MIQQLRQLGRATMNQWAAQAEAHVGIELQAQDATARGLKMKTLTWWCVFGVVTVDERQARGQGY